MCTNIRYAHPCCLLNLQMLPFGFDRGGVDLADAVELKLAELLPRFRQLADDAMQALKQEQQQHRPSEPQEPKSSSN